MQFIWLYVDDMLGKGIEWYVIVELLIYSSANLVPLALPLSVLLASLMTFGNLGEHFELVSFKAAGISLQKIMRPIFVFVAFLSVAAFLFSNHVVPVANLKFFSLLHDIRSQKPAINIKPGVFYSEIEGYTIRVKEKEETEDGREMLKDVMIYNHTENNGNRQLTIADSGIMSISPDKSYFSIVLFNGIDYQDQQEARVNKLYPFSRFAFQENEMRISLEGFQFNRTDEDAFKHDYRLFNLKQISHQTDTLEREYQNHIADIEQLLKNSYLFNDTIFTKQRKIGTSIPNFEEYLSSLSETEMNQIYGIAISNCRTNKGRSGAAASQQVINRRSIARLGIEWHRKYAFSLACIIMFFIGAPLGAIVKKGGLGMPVVISVIFFIFFWVLSIIGEDMAKEMVIQPYQGMWLSFFVLLPLGIFFTYKATTDSVMFNLDAYFGVFKKLFVKQPKEDVIK